MVQIKLTNGKSCEVNWEDNSRSVLELRRLISSKLEGIDLTDAKMVHRGQVMENELPTSRYGITMNSVIFVVLKNTKTVSATTNSTDVEEDSDKEEREDPVTNPSSEQGTNGVGGSSTTSGFQNPFGAFGSGGMNPMQMVSDMMRNSPELLSNLTNNPMLAGVMDNPMFKEIISNPKYMNFMMRVISDPVLAPIVMTNDVSKLMEPEIMGRFNQIITEEMPELFSTLSNSFMSGFNPFAAMANGQNNIFSQMGNNSAHPAGRQSPMQSPGSMPVPAAGTKNNANDKEEESDDALDEVYQGAAADGKPFNSLGQREAINEFINRMLRQDDAQSTTPAPVSKQTEAPVANPAENAQVTTTAEAPSAEPSQAELAERFHSQLESIHAMGFFDDERILNLLQLTSGDINAVVDRLLGDM